MTYVSNENLLWMIPPEGMQPCIFDGEMDGPDGAAIAAKSIQQKLPCGDTYAGVASVE